MSTLIRTANSTYELDGPAKRVRRLEGVNDPTPRFTPDGEWKELAGFLLDGCSGWFFWPDGSLTRTSALDNPTYEKGGDTA